MDEDRLAEQIAGLARDFQLQDEALMMAVKFACYGAIYQSYNANGDRLYDANGETLPFRWTCSTFEGDMVVAEIAQRISAKVIALLD